MANEKNIKLKTGDYAFIQGDEKVDNVFIVKTGKIELKHDNTSITLSKQHLGPGDPLGFISALSKKPRLTSAMAIENSVLLKFTRNEFIALLHKNPNIAMKIVNYFVNELRNYDHQLISFEKDQDSLDCDTNLYNLGMYYLNNNQISCANHVFNACIKNYPESSLIKEARQKIKAIEDMGVKLPAEPAMKGMYKIFDDGQMIFCENEPGEELYIIMKGKVRIAKFSNNSELLLAFLGEKDIFGELAIISDKPRNASAISIGPTELLPVNKDTIMQLFEKSPDLLDRLFTSICQRVWFTVIRIESRFYKKPITRVLAFLENKLLEENISLKSRSAHTFSFSINEVLKMLDLDSGDNNDIIDKLIAETDLHLHFGQIKINDICSFQGRSSYFKSRDHLVEDSGKKKEKEVSFDENRRVQVDKQDDEEKKSLDEIIEDSTKSDEIQT